MSDAAANALMWSVIAAAIAVVIYGCEQKDTELAKSQNSIVEACVKSGGDWVQGWMGPNCQRKGASQ